MLIDVLRLRGYRGPFSDVVQTVRVACAMAGRIVISTVVIGIIIIIIIDISTVNTVIVIIVSIIVVDGTVVVIIMNIIIIVTAIASIVTTVKILLSLLLPLLILTLSILLPLTLTLSLLLALLLLTGLEGFLISRYIDLRSVRQLSVSLEKLQHPMNGDVIWQDDVTDSGMQQLGDDVVSKDVR